MRKIAADAVVIHNHNLLLIKRGKPPFEHMLALPGGHLDDDETLEMCVAREVFEETGCEVKPLKLVGVYSDPQRDPRKTVSVAYLCKFVGGKLKSGTDASQALWVPLREAINYELAFDHNKIVKDAMHMLDGGD